jgi:hypothetical protein
LWLWRCISIDIFSTRPNGVLYADSPGVNETIGFLAFDRMIYPVQKETLMLCLRQVVPSLEQFVPWGELNSGQSANVLRTWNAQVVTDHRCTCVPCVPALLLTDGNTSFYPQALVNITMVYAVDGENVSTIPVAEVSRSSTGRPLVRS